MEIIKQGAEAKLYLIDFNGRKAIVKQRFKKKYRHPQLDDQLTPRRVLQEARCLQKLPVLVPQLYLVDLPNNSIYMEYIEGVTIRDHICSGTANLKQIGTCIGKQLATIHDIDIVHGDLTSSNILLKDNELVWIDFGLSYVSHLPEDKGVDIYVLERALQSTHPKEAEQLNQTCNYETLEIPNNFEPSDITMDDKNIYVVSDNGKIGIFDKSGNYQSKIKIAGKPDLEGITVIDKRPNILFLAVEYPPTLIEYDLTTDKMEREWDLSEYLIEHGEAHEHESPRSQGIESLVYVENDGAGYFFVGRQHDGMIFVFEITFTEPIDIEFYTKFQPFKRGDLSSLQVYNNHLFLLYDRPEILQSISLSGLFRFTEHKVGEGDSELLGYMDFRGLEGILFTDDYVYLCVDHNDDQRLLRMKKQDFFNCFYYGRALEYYQ
ncbi:TP53 regulating kinase [Terramyces sp. JEL0728]|nr:TP53 regulating kinase [Terramyces sp. JEL0728]